MNTFLAAFLGFGAPAVEAPKPPLPVVSIREVEEPKFHEAKKAEAKKSVTPDFCPCGGSPLPDCACASKAKAPVKDPEPQTKQWVALTTEPGIEAYGRLVNGYVYEIEGRRYLPGYGPAPKQSSCSNGQCGTSAGWGRRRR